MSGRDKGKSRKYLKGDLECSVANASKANIN